VCERKLKEVIPVLNDAIEGLLLIKKEEVDEIRSFKNPTPTLKTLVKALCIVLRVEPITSRDNSEDYWTPGVGPQALGDKRIIQRLTTIEPKTLDAEVMIKLEQLCSTDDL